MSPELGTLPNGMRMQSSAADAFRRANDQFHRQYGRDIRVSSAYRSDEHQRELYNKLHGIRAVAPPGHSNHNWNPQNGRFATAVDITGSDIQSARPYLENNGFQWTGQHLKNDPYHFDFKGSIQKDGPQYAANPRPENRPSGGRQQPDPRAGPTRQTPQRPDTRVANNGEFFNWGTTTPQPAVSQPDYTDGGTPVAQNQNEISDDIFKYS